MFGWTVTVWVHCALSEAVALPFSAYEPECTGDVTAPEPLPVQDQPESEPLSKPGLVSRLAA